MGVLISKIKRYFKDKDNIDDLEWKLDFMVKCLKEYKEIKIKDLKDIGILIHYIK